MTKKPILLLATGAITVLIGSAFAAGQSGITLPADYRQWFHVNSMTVDKTSPLSPQLGGLHNVYINSKGLPALKSGGSYPDGSVFLDDIHEFSVSDGSYIEGNRKAIAIMVRDAKKYASTAGWGWQVWIGGDPKKPVVTDANTMCVQCHSQHKDNSYVFSTYIP
ncbi:MAG: cytochrome P460 family protein [Blastocatellia bacterium]